MAVFLITTLYVLSRRWFVYYRLSNPFNSQFFAEEEKENYRSDQKQLG